MKNHLKEIMPFTNYTFPSSQIARKNHDAHGKQKSIIVCKLLFNYRQPITIDSSGWRRIVFLRALSAKYPK